MHNKFSKAREPHYMHLTVQMKKKVPNHKVLALVITRAFGAVGLLYDWYQYSNNPGCLMLSSMSPSPTASFYRRGAVGANRNQKIPL